MTDETGWPDGGEEQGLLRPALPHAAAVTYDIDFLTHRELLEVRDQIWAMREGWRTLSQAQEFHTLGYSTYLDAATDTSRPYYYQGNPSTNAILRKRLEWLYRRLLDCLERYLGAPVRYRPKCAIPGFHILLGGGDVAQHFSSIHTDRGFEFLSWSPTETPDFARTVSFTLAIQLPRAGAGLNVWPGDEALDAPPVLPNRLNPVRAAFLDSYEHRPHHLHEYREGVLVLHSGHTVHQAVVGERARGDNRITLQGHGVFCGGEWQIYW